ncbi:hypothetical protein ACLKA7_001774 [Drosophila subpalustris]
MLVAKHLSSSLVISTLGPPSGGVNLQLQGDQLYWTRSHPSKYASSTPAQEHFQQGWPRVDHRRNVYTEPVTRPWL